MAVSADAGADPLSIGSSNNVGRSLAFGILSSKSIPHLRQQMRHALLNAVPTLRQFLLPIIKWLRPRNRTIVAMVAVVVFILHRHTNVKQKAEMAYRRKFWKAMMKTASNYEEWAHAAKMLDKEGPKVNEWDMYDEELVWNKLQELRNRRQEGSIRDIIFSLRADLIRNLGNMCNPDLHKGRLQVPKLINEYIEEVSFQLKMVCDSDSEDLPFEEKLIFMHETRHAFGRTALLLSGGASLGAFHIGVLRTLVEHKFLPRIIAGSSVGSVFCAMTATRTSSELQSFFDDSLHSMKFFDQMGGVYSVAKRVLSGGAVHDIRQLQMLLRQMTNNLTFQEAYDLTGQILGITVCSPRKHEPPRCLNYLTSPHVVIWSAVTASCAFPGLFEAQELMAKDRNGEIVPYHPPFNFEPEEGSSSNVRRWRDGSLEVDLPMMQLKELFNVNHFIVSQLNPHIAPLLRIKEFVRAHGGYFASKVAHIFELEVKHRCNQMLELGFPLGGLAKLFAQEWEGDVTIVMPATLSQYAKLIQNPSYVELKKAATQGRRCTWEKLAAIKANYGIELALDECVATLNHMRRLRRIAEKAAGSSRGLIAAAKFSASRRIPSWNVLARENSTSSFEEDLQSVSDTSSVHRRYSGSGSSGRGPSSRFRHRRNLPDPSDTESEINSVYSSSRFGGPLMRNAATDKFAHSVPNLDNGAEQNRGLVDPNSVTLQIGVNNPYPHNGRVAAPERGSEDTEFDLDDRVPTNGFCATRTEGDLLQPEGTNNELMFNVIKEEEHDGESYENDVPECVQIDCHGHGKEIDGSSVSECGDDHVSATKV